MSIFFNQQKLKVYYRAWTCCAERCPLADSRDPIHSITDHLPRAAEGIVLNIAEASAAHTGAKVPLLDSVWDRHSTRTSQAWYLTSPKEMAGFRERVIVASSRLHIGRR